MAALLLGLSGAPQVLAAWPSDGVAAACVDDCDARHPDAPCPPICDACHGSSMRTCDASGMRERDLAAPSCSHSESLVWLTHTPPQRLGGDDVFHPPRA